MKLQADTNYGVYEVAEFDDSATPLEQSDFYDSLCTLTDGELICAEVDAIEKEAIAYEYGITSEHMRPL